MDIIKQIEAESLREVASFNVGDTVRVNFKVIEGNKERIQAYEGIVIARKHRCGTYIPRTQPQDRQHHCCTQGQC